MVDDEYKSQITTASLKTVMTVEQELFAISENIYVLLKIISYSKWVVFFWASTGQQTFPKDISSIVMLTSKLFFLYKSVNNLEKYSSAK